MRHFNAAITRNPGHPALLDEIGGLIVIADALGFLRGNGISFVPETIVNREFAVYLPLIVPIERNLPGAKRQRENVLYIVAQRSRRTQQKVGDLIVFVGTRTTVERS